MSAQDLRLVLEELQDALMQLLQLEKKFEKSLPNSERLKRAMDDLHRAEVLLIDGGVR